MLAEALERTLALERYRLTFEVISSTRSADDVLQRSFLSAFVGTFAGENVAYQQSLGVEQHGIAGEVMIVDSETYRRAPLH